ncbi:MAG: hypothetical protein LBH39_01475, partial [Clostridiales Family XIII bacterium]|nr:hypothetical protein [Clostridiales Family XIII bacterium]
MERGYAQKLTPLMALRLAAPHTWPSASIMPVLLGILLAADLAGESSLLMSLALMLIVILMQSAANT